MAPRQRIVLLIIAAVVLVGGIALAASSGGDDESSDSGGTTPAQTQAGVQTTPEGEEQPAAPKPRLETIRIRGGKPVGGAQTLKYDSGDTIALRFVSDAPGEAHVHGFDKEVEVSREAQIIRFKANLEGIFEIEEHDTGELLAKLEVRPK
ncbi:MAG TPA: hypothetical protein VF587_10140 [Solirubrobacteraceae bacterium]|jgi:hypothetical protein